jgi:hypothetical protein
MRSPALRSATLEEEVMAPTVLALPTSEQVSRTEGKAPAQALAGIASTADLLVALLPRHRR